MRRRDSDRRQAPSPRPHTFRGSCAAARPQRHDRRRRRADGVRLPVRPAKSPALRRALMSRSRLQLQARQHTTARPAMEIASWPGFPPQSRVIPPLIITTLFVCACAPRPGSSCSPGARPRLDRRQGLRAPAAAAARAGPRRAGAARRLVLSERPRADVRRHVRLHRVSRYTSSARRWCAGRCPSACSGWSGSSGRAGSTRVTTGRATWRRRTCSACRT